MESIENKAIRIGISTLRGLLPALETFLNIMASPKYKDKPPAQVAKELEAYANTAKELESYAYENADEFYRDQVMVGNNIFNSEGIENTQLEKFDQLARQYGLKYYPERKPENLNELIQKQNPSKEDKSILLLWTKEINGKRVPSDDDMKITFAEKDLPKMEHIVKDLREYTDKHLNERLHEAKQTKNDMNRQKQQQTKEKSTAMVEQER